MGGEDHPGPEFSKAGGSSCPFEGCFHLPSIFIVSVEHTEHRRSRGEVGILPFYAGRETALRGSERKYVSRSFIGFSKEPELRSHVLQRRKF